MTERWISTTIQNRGRANWVRSPWRCGDVQTRWRSLWFALLLVYIVSGARSAQAHGGVIIDNGVTDDYEWLAVVSPYPVSVGETMLTLLVYDLNTAAPIDGLESEVLLRRPGDPSPCCNPSQHLGPYALLAEPEQFPGDYSAALSFGEMGDWEALFEVRAGAKSFPQPCRSTWSLLPRPSRSRGPRVGRRSGLIRRQVPLRSCLPMRWQADNQRSDRRGGCGLCWR
ncbi:MAG: hypothetical protein HC802_11975 [Caldilineaceae bacterium]|nr:hypothetical protein [Caldilineaceae bacterium]